MQNKRRVVVTGIGAITPIGHGAVGLWNGVREGKSGVQTVDRFDTSQIRTTVAAQINDFDPLEYLEAKTARRLDRFAQLALAACELSLLDANLRPDRGSPDHRIGVTMGTALGGVAGAEREHERYLSGGLRAVDTSLALLVFGAAGSSSIAIRYGCLGPSNANSNSCSSGTMAIGEGYRYIREGYADVMIAASAEAPLYELTFSSFTLIRTMSVNPDPLTACRPFDKDRDGFVMAEAAAVLILEELGHALHRGAKIYCELAGYSCNNDGHHMVAPRPDGTAAARAINDSLAEAGLSPDDIGYINAHGSSTQLNDRVETALIQRVFGERTRDIPVSSTKSMHGHSLGASGAVEAAICAMIFGKDYLPPTLHLENPDPECDLDHIVHAGRSSTVDAILSNSFGFGGINAVLVFRRFAQ